MKVCVIDYKMGNLGSIANVLEEIKCNYVISNRAKEIEESDKLVLPGVGAFLKGMDNLRKLGLVDILGREVLVKRKPILGVCLGMQLFADKGFENGEHRGLGWISGEVKRLFPNDNTLKVPHVGWNDIKIKKDSKLFLKIGGDASFYFVHSYYFSAPEENVTSTFEYGGEFTASVEKGNLFGAQFHPEKSAENGLTLLKNFVGV